MVETLIPHLRDEVTLSDDYTLADLFKILESEVDNFNLIFGSHLGHYPLSDYIKDINKDVVVDNSEQGIDYLEVYWTCVCEDYEARGYKEWKKDINFNADFHGYGTWADDEHSPYPDNFKGGIAIEFTPLAELKDIILKIRNKTKVILDDGTYHKNEDGDLTDKVLFEGDRYFSVFDFISTILYEISYAGSPDIRDESLKDLISTHEEVKEKIDSGDTSCFKNFEELKKDLENEES
jgi:hypothetical protein